MAEGEIDETVVDTAIGICKVQPAHCQRLVLLPCIVEDGREFTAWCSSHERLLDGSVKVPVAKHDRQPPSFQDGREQLANTGCEGNRADVRGVLWVL